jgi:hypothetical protein
LLFTSNCAAGLKLLANHNEICNLGHDHRRVLSAYTAEKAATVRLFKSFGETPPDIALTSKYRRKQANEVQAGWGLHAIITEELILDAATQETLDSSMNDLQQVSHLLGAAMVTATDLKHQLETSTCGMSTHGQLPCLIQSSAALERQQLEQDIVTNKSRLERLRAQVQEKKAATRVAFNNHGVREPTDQQRAHLRRKRRENNQVGSMTAESAATQAALDASLRSWNKRSAEWGAARAAHSDINHRWTEATSGMYTRSRIHTLLPFVSLHLLQLWTGAPWNEQ